MAQSAINTVIVFQVRRRLSEIFAQAQAEIETLKKTENELRMGQSKLEDLGRRLDQEQVEFLKISY
jgi:ESCRT-I complex subunit TSG101